VTWLRNDVHIEIDHHIENDGTQGITLEDFFAEWNAV
jgi:hypothetical protein